MSKNQEGSVEYVNFHKIQRSNIVKEKLLTKSTKSSSNKTIAKQTAHQNINIIRAFFNKPEVKSLLSGEKKYNLDLPNNTDDINHQIYIKAMKIILQHSKSSKNTKRVS